jgi:hypothetical protein
MFRLIFLAFVSIFCMLQFVQASEIACSNNVALKYTDSQSLIFEPADRLIGIFNSSKNKSDKKMALVMMQNHLKCVQSKSVINENFEIVKSQAAEMEISIINLQSFSCAEAANHVAFSQSLNESETEENSPSAQTKQKIGEILSAYCR